MNYFSNKLQNTIVKSFPIILILLGLTLPVMAAWTQKQKITSTPRGVAAQHGNAVSIHGGRMVVGAWQDGTTAPQAGAAFVYRLVGGVWTQEAKLLAYDGAVADKFGYSVGIFEDTIVVGAYNADAPLSNSGAAYVFVWNGTTWTQQQKLMAISIGTPPTNLSEDEFGNAVAIQAETIVVGAHFADLPSGSAAGLAYIFTRSPGGTIWTEVQKLEPIGGVLLGNYFGESLAFNGKIVVGSSGADIPSGDAGSVYVFASNGSSYIQEAKLSIPGGGNGDAFGCSVAIQGNTLVGGARGNTPIIGQPAYGAAYIYEFNGATWQSQGKIVASDGASVDRFGWSVAVGNNVIAVGARDDDTTVGGDAGSAYIFTRNGTTWTQQQKLAPTDPFNGDRFGSGVALSFDGGLVVGAAEKILTSPNGEGAVYYFTFGIPKSFDFDGDGKTDISIFRPPVAQWWIQRSFDNSVRAFQFGTASDKPVPADYDGDGKTDVAFFRSSTGEWFILRSSNLTFYSFPFGNSTDKPAPGDFDGDGISDAVVFRSSEGTWYISKSSGGTLIMQWGQSGDIPINADYDGDGISDLAIFRPSNGQWWLNRSTAGITATTFGVGNDKPVPADFTGDGKADIAVWRPDNGSWYVLRSEDFSYFAVPFGTNGDIPAPGDYDGDGKADFAIFRPDGANWFIQRSTAGTLIQQFGATGDLPTQASFIP